jgi:hypothetical protein
MFIEAITIIHYNVTSSHRCILFLIYRRRSNLEALYLLSPILLDPTAPTRIWSLPISHSTALKMIVAHRQLENSQWGIPQLKTITRSRHAGMIIIIQANFVGVSHFIIQLGLGYLVLGRNVNHIQAIGKRFMNV